MAEFQPVTSLADLSTLDAGEVLAGYRSGFAGDPEPGNNHSRSFWHGYRNGRTDAGLAPVDDAQRALVKAATYRRADGVVAVVDPTKLKRGRGDA